MNPEIEIITKVIVDRVVIAKHEGPIGSLATLIRWAQEDAAMAKNGWLEEGGN